MRPKSIQGTKDWEVLLCISSRATFNLWISKRYIWSIALYGAETWTLRAVDQKHLESFEMWCWRRMENISWTDHVRDKDVLLRV
jgi:hypothetical protein